MFAIAPSSNQNDNYKSVLHFDLFASVGRLMVMQRDVLSRRERTRLRILGTLRKFYNFALVVVWLAVGFLDACNSE